MRCFLSVWILFPFIMTALGAAAVFLFRKEIGARVQRVCLGFAAGVMAAATAFSMLMPAAAQLEAAGRDAWMVLAFGFLAGAGMILLLPCQDQNMSLMTAVTLHNIPEGMAVGVALAGAGAPAAAAAVSLGIGMQNLPEGAAVSLPLRQRGMSRRKSFLLGVLSGAVEPLAAGAVLLFAPQIAPLMPLLMAFSAGAMLAVVFDELMPAAAVSKDGVIAAVFGFALMMAMDLGHFAG